jgi:hypothetical protein
VRYSTFISVLILSLLCGSGFVLSAQNINSFLELGGSGGLGSFNHEFLKPLRSGEKANKNDNSKLNNWSRGVRFGIGFTPVDKNNGFVVVVPLMETVHYRKNDSPHVLEISGGVAPSISSKGAWYIKSPLALGYRYDQQDKKLFYRIAYTPIIGWLVDYNWQHWAGISIGYKFK